MLSVVDIKDCTSIIWSYNMVYINKIFRQLVYFNTKKQVFIKGKLSSY